MEISTILVQYQRPKGRAIDGARIKRTRKYIAKFSRFYCSSTNCTKLNHSSRKASVTTIFHLSNRHEIFLNLCVPVQEKSLYIASVNGETVQFLDLRICNGQC